MIISDYFYQLLMTFKMCIVHGMLSCTSFEESYNLKLLWLNLTAVRKCDQDPRGF